MLEKITNSDFLRVHVGGMGVTHMCDIFFECVKFTYLILKCSSTFELLTE